MPAYVGRWASSRWRLPATGARRGQQPLGLGPPHDADADGLVTQNQNGGTSSPANDASGPEEISVDIDLVFATCAKCHILVVEASWPSYDHQLSELSGVAERVPAWLGEHGHAVGLGTDRYASP